MNTIRWFGLLVKVLTALTVDNGNGWYYHSAEGRNVATSAALPTVRSS